MKMKMKRMGMTAVLVLLLSLTGCASMNSNSSSSFDQNNQTQQLIIKTSIQLATATYLDKDNSKKYVDLVIKTTDEVMLYTSGDDIYNKTTVELQAQLHELISNLDISVPQKIALTSLGDLIFSEAVSWANIDITNLISKEQANALFFCANAMNETAKMYIQPESEGRSYSVNNQYEEVKK